MQRRHYTSLAFWATNRNKAVGVSEPELQIPNQADTVASLVLPQELPVDSLTGGSAAKTAARPSKAA